jgi:membrane fusion protein (multidrug efflux system)
MRSILRLPTEMRLTAIFTVTEKMRIMKILANKTAIQRLTWFSLITLMLAIAMTIGCSGNGANNDKASQPGGMRAGKAGRMGAFGPMTEVSVQTTKIQRISLQREVDLAGSLIASDQAKVSSEVAGIVREVLVELGQVVSMGQVVVRLDTRELELALQRAQSQLRQAEAQLGINGAAVKDPPADEEISSVRLAQANRDDAMAQLRRAQKLRSQNLLPQADLDTAETRVKVTDANYRTALENVQSLKATLQDRLHAVELAQKKLNDSNIRASIAGQISERLVNQGEFIRENTAVVSVVKMNPLKLETAIQERYAGIVHPGLPVEFAVESAPGKTFSARVAHVSPSVDTATRTFAVEILVNNSNGMLKPGFFAKGIIFTRRDENVIAIPEYAISTLAGVSNVYIIDQGKIRQQAISLGAHLGNLVEVLDGLQGSELLAASNLTMLATGVPVKITGNMDSSINSNRGMPSAANPTMSVSKQGGRR